MIICMPPQRFRESALVSCRLPRRLILELLVAPEQRQDLNVVSPTLQPIDNLKDVSHSAGEVRARHDECYPHYERPLVRQAGSR